MTKAQVKGIVRKIRTSMSKKAGRLAPRAVVAKRLKVSTGSLFNWENGLSRPTARHLDGLAKLAREVG